MNEERIAPAQTPVEIKDWKGLYDSAKGKTEKDKVVQQMIEEINLQTNKCYTLKQSFESMTSKVEALSQEIERNKGYYHNVLRFVKTQVAAFTDAVAQVTGGLE